MKRRPKFIKRRLPILTKCPVCEEGLILAYKKPEILGRFISDRGKILSRPRSGICAKHQRKLARQVKRARFLALLPYVARIK